MLSSAFSSIAANSALRASLPSPKSFFSSSSALTNSDLEMVRLLSVSRVLKMTAYLAYRVFWQARASSLPYSTPRNCSNVIFSSPTAANASRLLKPSLRTESGRCSPILSRNTSLPTASISSSVSLPSPLPAASMALNSTRSCRSSFWAFSLSCSALTRRPSSLARRDRRNLISPLMGTLLIASVSTDRSFPISTSLTASTTSWAIISPFLTASD
mmetsp:Transcript_25765/g.60828  ORF Transcript_25765/g.60828 Transcript_25765/m.60828 type:complete len:215 (+) Transcript_25765:612-1256(+)